MLPLLVTAAMAAAQLLAAGAAAELAGHAAEAGAMAMLQGRDPAAAARQAVPGWSRARMRIEVRGSRIRVTLRPPSLWPALAEQLTAARDADAGPMRAEPQRGQP